LVATKLIAVARVPPVLGGSSPHDREHAFPTPGNTSEKTPAASASPAAYAAVTTL